jgi:predicted 2-oxoglutarate/Fe(II)-dependent dioxygenase YbiX
MIEPENDRKMIYITDLITRDECNRIIDTLDKSSTVLAALNPVNGDFSVDKSKRYAFDTDTNDDQVKDRIMLTACPKIEDYFDCEIEWWEEPRFKIYRKGCHFGLHADAVHLHEGKSIKYCDRDFSFILFLNDNYEGGNLSFPEFNLTVPPKAGRMVVFPPDARFMHRVLPVTQGERFQMLGWLRAKDTAQEHNPALHGPFLPRVDRNTLERLT